MTVDDDDLPVLTQVLRTGTGPRPAMAPVDAVPTDVVLLADPLVIGNEPRPAIGAYLAPSIHDPAVDAVAVATETTDDRASPPTHDPDAFRLPQDHDGATTPRPSTLDVPELEAPAHAAVEEPGAVERRVREAVVEDLRTRIDTELDARIAQALHVEVESVLAQLQQNLRAHLSDALRDVVAKAVDDAIAHRSGSGAPVV